MDHVTHNDCAMRGVSLRDFTARVPGTDCFICFFGLLLVVSGGCRRSPPVAQAVGSVTLNGKVVTSGDVVMVGSDGRSVPPGRVRADGTYVIERLPVGLVKVGFFNPPPPPLPAGRAASAGGDEELVQMREAAKRYVPTPAKYADPSQSGIEFVLEPGRNECNIELR